LLPDIHPLVDSLYEPYDIGQMGQLDVHILSELFGGDNTARDLTPAWDGGLYWAGQLHSAKSPEEQSSTKSLALFYLSVWKNADSAQVFAKLYADSLGRKYSHLSQVSTGSRSSADGSDEKVFTTSEGPVVITTRGKMVFVAESFPLPIAHKLTSLILDGQGGGAIRMTRLDQPVGESTRASEQLSAPLSSSLVRFIENCGVMKAAVDGAMAGAHGSMSR
jgi:hypothetical protein